MEIFDKIGDWGTAVTSVIERSITRVFGASNERTLRKIGFIREKNGKDTILPGSLLDRIGKFESHYQQLSDAELKETATKLRARLAAGETLEDVTADAFAAVRESSRRYLKMRHYDVQLIGGYILHQGKIAEMVTGEGKTLVATLPAFLNGLVGKVHVVTVNDYLARRDMEWMAPVYLGLGLTVGAIQSNMDPYERHPQYACDITYGTNNEFGFDYLRDNMKPRKELQVQGPLDFAIVDEIDNILIDEARTPLIISGKAHDDVEKYKKANRVAQQLKAGEDFEVKEKEHTCHMTEAGVRRAEQLAGVESFYTTGNMEWPHLIDNALRAHHLYKRDVNYVVEDGQIVIVDEFTGRKMEGRQWSDGLHQAVEAKEGVKVKEESQTLATITLQNYFKLYKKLGGMTGTAMTEAQEFWKVYKLDVVTIPPNRTLQRVNSVDVIFRSAEEKWEAVVDEIREVHKQGRPILVGTVSIEKSEFLSHLLTKFGIQHAVLNAKYHEREAEIIAQAGRTGAVTIATNMAGRGTDIILGGNPEHMAWEEFKTRYASRLEIPKAEWDALTKKIAEREGMVVEGRKVAELGGLHVIGTERHDARRIDLQLRGRAGRQGDPGSSRFFLSLEDDLMRVFAGEWVKNMLTRLGMQHGEAIESKMVSRQIEKAQKRVEERHFDSRKNLLEYDEVMDEQRKSVYSYRQRILDGANSRELILDMMKSQIDAKIRIYLDPAFRWDTIVAAVGRELGIEIERSAIVDMTFDQLTEYIKDETRQQAEQQIYEQIDENLPTSADESEWSWRALSQWANARFGLNTSDRELKKIGRDHLYDDLVKRAGEGIERLDLSSMQILLEPDLGQHSLSGWLQQQFTLDIPPATFDDKTQSEAREIIFERLTQLYLSKEVSFPVAVAMQRFLSDEGNRGGERYDRAGAAQWASDRFDTAIDPSRYEGLSRANIEQDLQQLSAEFFPKLDFRAELRDRLDRIFGNAANEPMPLTNGRARKHLPQNPAALNELIEWAQSLRLSVSSENLAGLDRQEVSNRLWGEFDARYRPELAEAERALLLEVLDTAWKDHLYYMDHLRHGVGLVGYAQKDPKVEYKREGRKAFLAMWERIGEQVTGAIFRMEQESPGFVGSLWEITSTTHDEAPPVPERLEGYETVGQDYDGEAIEDRPAVEPIRNRGPKPGRNDPCPCGSGKKYKKCCGAND